MNTNPTPSRILVVEDDEVNTMIAMHILGKQGFEVSTVSNGEEAVEIVKTDTFDLILMDIEMPIMDGIEATRIIRTLDAGKRIPIIALTAHQIPEKIAEFQQAGMNDYVLKPIDPEKLQDLIQTHLSVSE